LEWLVGLRLIAPGVAEFGESFVPAAFAKVNDRGPKAVTASDLLGGGFLR
jgi:hypothetical protein